jgi:ribosomal protein S10
MLINIIIYSKNINSINKFLNFFYKKLTFKILKYQIFKSKFQKPIQKKILTVLKSPHVNKTAQEQFEYRLFRKQLTLFSYKSGLFLILLKYIKFKLFPDLKIKIILFSNSTKQYKAVQNRINPNNFNSSLILNYLKIFDLHGEILLKK